MHRTQTATQIPNAKWILKKKKEWINQDYIGSTHHLWIKKSIKINQKKKDLATNRTQQISSRIKTQIPIAIEHRAWNKQNLFQFFICGTPFICKRSLHLLLWISGWGRRMKSSFKVEVRGWGGIAAEGREIFWWAALDDGKTRWINLENNFSLGWNKSLEHGLFLSFEKQRQRGQVDKFKEQETKATRLENEYGKDSKYGRNRNARNLVVLKT